LGADILHGRDGSVSGVAAGADLFVIPTGSSLPAAHQYDTIYYTSGDKIDLPFALATFHVDPTVFDTCSESVATGVRDNFPVVAGVVQDVQVLPTGGTNSYYILTDTSGNHAIDATDAFIKVVGVNGPIGIGAWANILV
jgi:hypothetical protein